MRFLPVFALIAVPLLLVSRTCGGESARALVTKLGSANYQERQAASKSLLDRPDAEPALRDALRSPDGEVRKRAGDLLNHFRQCALEIATKEGRVQRVVELLGDWDKGQDEEAWNVVRKLAHKLVDLHNQKVGKKMDFPPYRGAKQPAVVCGERISKVATQDPFRALFFRAKELDFEPGVGMMTDRVAAILTSGNARTFAEGNGPQVIIAGGNVEVRGNVHDILILSCGDVQLKGGSLERCLVIAHGKIVSKGTLVVDCRVVSGKSFTRSERATQNCIITENESNPLGYIRWADAPKDKSGIKSK